MKFYILSKFIFLLLCLHFQFSFGSDYDFQDYLSSSNTSSTLSKMSTEQT
jgi:hypothetical protein